MKIAFFLDIFYPEINGVTNSSVNLALNLIKLGHDVIFVAPKSKKFDKEIVHDKIRVLYLKSISTFIYPNLRLSSPIDIPFSHRLKKEKIDIVHITAPFAMGFFALNFAKFNKIPVVHTFHTMINEPAYLKHFLKSDRMVTLGQKMVIKYIKPFIKNCDVLTAPTRYVYDFITNHYPGTEVVQISNGIDIEIFNTYESFTTLTKKYPEYNRKSFIFVGRLGHEKSIDILIKAVHFAVQKDREIQLFIVGSGPDGNKFKELVDSLSLKSNIHFLGRIEYESLIKSGLLQHARAFVTASKTETQCMTVMEAIIAGIPVIIPDVPGINELFNNNGRLFKADDTEELSRHILEMAENDDIFRKYSEGAHKMYNKWDGKEIALTFEKLYREQIEKKRHKKRAS